MLRKLADPLLSLAYPQACLSCGDIVESVAFGVACGRCWESTGTFTGSEVLCRKCGALPADSSAASEFECGQCSTARFDTAIAAGVYESALSATVVSLKSRPYLPQRARLLIQSLSDRARPDASAVIIPVPLSRRRQFERGFNQADVIADLVARRTGLRCERANLIRTTHTPIHRVGMDRKARELTVRNAFEVRFPRLIEGRNVFLVDDVFTSGATTSYCAKALKKNGASRVDVLTLARAVMQSPDSIFRVRRTPGSDGPR